MAPLHLASVKGHLDVVKCLLQDRDCNPNVNIDGWTPLLLATECKHPAVARELVKAGAYAEESLPKPQVKVFIVGNPSVGKSSLKEALLAETSRLWVLLASITSPKLVSVEQQTPGIVPYEFESKKYGLVTFYDLAGQQEYYASHSALLKDSITSSLFIIVVNLCDNEEDIKQKLEFWISFLANHCTSVITKPHVIIVGSHSDVVRSRGEDPSAKVNMEFLQTMHVASGFHISKLFIPMDCRQSNSHEIITLAESMKKSCDDLRRQLKSAYHFHLLFVHLLIYNDVSAVSFDEVSKDFSEDSELHDDLSELHDRGDIVYLKGNKKWIILDKDALLSEVNGVLFAPEDFEQHCDLANATGVVPLSKLAQKFSKHNPDMLVQFFSYFEFCCEIPNCEVLELINQENTPQSGTTNERYLFFPGLITSTILSGVWNSKALFPQVCGWILQCCKVGQLLTSQFLQVVLLRIAFSCALASDESSDFPVLQRKCSIWKSGIYWGSRKGVEALVEIRDPPQNKFVLVMLRCMSGKEVECARLRSTIIQTVFEAKEKLCPKVPTKEYFLHPSQVKEYSFKTPAKRKLVSVVEVSKAVVKGEECVVGSSGEPIDFKTLLLVEPYTNLNENVLQELFSGEAKVVSDRFLYSVAECVHDKNKKDILLTMLNVSQGRLEDMIALQPPISKFKTYFLLLQCWRGDSGTYQSLRETLDQFSVFAGRNPMVSEIDCLEIAYK